ncbi:MAG: DUF116 domain-containing protein [Bacteroidota bacterium]|nr:DUF116 domain-containing protein [Bacteroidota bacterium]
MGTSKQTRRSKSIRDRQGLSNMEQFNNETSIKTITYNLMRNEENSDFYYNEISNFTDAVLLKADDRFRPLVKLYMEYIRQNSLENLRSEHEYLFEFISLGVYWKIYGLRSLAVNPYIAKFLAKLYELRRNHRHLKPSIDYIRGILGTIFLVKEDLEENTNNINSNIPSLNNLKSLVLWLEATGEFKEEVKRFKQWLGYLSIRSVIDINKYLKRLAEFASWFELKSEFLLSNYTYNIEEFQRTKLDGHKFKEDYIFCSRKKVEYHLSMFGAEVMNREFRDEFSKTVRKAVLLPACMRINNGMNCKARKNSLDLVCTGCNSQCRINQITNLGKNSGFAVHIIPHSSSFTKWLESWGVDQGIGVVGVACPLNLVTGGLEMKALDIAAQCVLLDYCGCKNHWDNGGISTALNINELMRIINSQEVNYAALAV